MKILSFDTTLETCSVAVTDGGACLAHRAERLGRGHAEALLPMIGTVMADAGINYSSLDVVAVTIGPGTFTGQRIGLAAARGIGLAQDIPVQGVTTLSAIAYGLSVDGLVNAGEDRLVALDARRGEIYVQSFPEPLIWPHIITEPAAVPVADVGHHIPKGPCVIAGTGVQLVEENCTEPSAGIRYLTTPNEADALHVAALAAQTIAVNGLPTTPPAPLYLRGPDAKLPGGRTL